VKYYIFYQNQISSSVVAMCFIMLAISCTFYFIGG